MLGNGEIGSGLIGTCDGESGAVIVRCILPLPLPLLLLPPAPLPLLLLASPDTTLGDCPLRLKPSEGEGPARPKFIAMLDIDRLGERGVVGTASALGVSGEKLGVLGLPDSEPRFEP